MKNVYAVYDVKAACFNAPACYGNDAIAERAFRALVNDPSSEISRFTEDFQLYKIGKFDEEKGVLEALVPPAVVITASACKEVK